MTPISRGFGGCRRDDVDPSRLPPGVTPTSVASRSCQPGRRRARGSEEWPFSIQGAGDEARSWTWDEFTALPAEHVTVDIHCVTKWSELDTR
jgi:DMSO/TMAO reductase YedYZ molybdopterin-dependent catalytic subunit